MSEKKRVAAYCRVSTNKEIQQSSLALQTEVFEQIATQNADWTLVKVYADEGLTGTSVKNRVQFQQMIKDALDGKIDYILAKSISRFARNTVDTLEYTRLLKEKGIGVYFEEQSLDTLNVTSEIFLTIHAAFAQEESHSISENQKRGYRNRYALGVPKWAATFGYRCEENGEWIPHKKEAKIVKLIFEKYLAGDSIPDICRHLMSKRVTPPEGEKTWHPHTVSMILHNEKYIGDVEMQKSYTVSHLTHKKVKNDGKKIPKYYIHDHHTAIIEREDFEIAQRILAMRDSHKGCYQYPFYGLLKCPFCGENMAAVPLRTRGLERAWTCIGKNGKTRQERTECKPACVKEKYILGAVLQAFRENDKNIRSLEYPMIYREIEHITFDSSDWHLLIIFWKNGQQSRVHIDYEKKSEVPANEIVIQDKSVYLDGVLMGSSPQDITAAKSILSIREYLQNVRITDTDNIPIVKAPRK